MGYQKGWGKFKKYTKTWENFVMKEVYPEVLKRFPTTKGMTVQKVASILVEMDYIEKFQRYAYKSWIAGGIDNPPPFREWTKQRMRFKPSGTKKTVNIWKNNSVHETARRVVRSIKKDARHFNERLNNLKKGDPAYIKSVFATIENPSKEMKRLLRKLEDGTITDKQKQALMDYIAKDITTNQYKKSVHQSIDSGANFWGKRLSQDQLTEANIESWEKTVDTVETEKRKTVLVGYYSLSPSHKKHYYPGGVDPCEKWANHTDPKFGKGAWRGDDIKIPKKDTHFGCKCSLKLVVEEL